ncbi:hemicentin-2 isoform X3 [Cherax quadricarinatus]|uniref:hemicentin-2 isoform X3 n=1 Tax=Cherax quadricarinatus TaxID=27406 RepID=UPI0023795804|nr:hemicentin-2-like isoform X3 [Cherax quadricarinatus]
MQLKAYFNQRQISSGVTSCAGSPTKREAATPNPKITYSKETIAKEGDEVKIDCAVEGVDLTGVQDFSVSWSKINEEKPANSYPISNNDRVLLFSSKFRVDHPADSQQYSLIIKKMSEEDSGLYRCTVNFGEDQKINADVPVTIQKAPYFTDDFTKTLTVTEGDAISIDCQPGGSPKPEVYWERLNQELPYYGGKFFKANQLDIPLVDRSHKGHYVCYANNGIGDPANSHVILEVQVPPEVVVTKDQVFASMTEEVMMECKVVAIPAADIAWLKDDLPILGSANYKIKTVPLEGDEGVVSTMAVTQVSSEDIGTYKCRATSAIGTAEKSIALITKSPPLISAQSRKEVLYDLQRNLGRDALPVVIECMAEGAPSPKYRWTKNNKTLIWEVDPRFSLEEGTGNLLISDPTMDDNGLYQCFAYNNLGTAVADPVYLLNTSRIEFSNDKDESDTYNVKAELGRPFKLSCPKVFGYPKPTLSWVKANQLETQIEIEFVNDERIISDPEGNLWFTHITEADDTRKNNFQFICLASTTFEPNDFSMASIIELSVVDPADGNLNLNEEQLNVESFPMYTSNDTVKFIALQENTLWCIFGGEPTPTVSWRMGNGTELNETSFTTRNSGSTLVFLDTKVEDAGEYQCIVSNGVGEVKTKSVVVVVEQEPTFMSAMESFTVEEGSTITFVCDVASTKNITYTWMYNGRVISLTGGNMRRIIKGNTLTIDDIISTDVGNYACNATSDTAYAYSQATLVVLPAGGYSTRQSGKLCDGMQELRNEIRALQDTIQLIYSAVREQQGLAQYTQDILSQVAEKLQVPAVRTNITPASVTDDGNKVGNTDEEDVEGELAATTVSP